MKPTLKLTGIYFKEMLLNLMGSSNKKSKSTLPLLVLLCLFIAGAIGYSLYNMASTLSMVGMAKNVLILGLLMSVFMSLMITLNDTQGTMYKSRDYDMLMSLPLRNVSIIFAKYMSTYLVSMVYYALIAIPTFIVYFIFEGVSALGIIFGLLSILFMPAFSQFISCCLGWLVNLITSRMRNKNIMRAILSLIMALGIALFMSFANSDIFNGLFSSGLPLWFQIVFSHICFLFSAVTNNSILYFLACLGVSVGFILLGVLVISIGYKRINTNLLSTRVRGKTKPIVYKEGSVFASLYKKEASTFFNSPVYCVNGLIGNIMVVVVVIISITTYNPIKDFVGAVPLFVAIAMFGMAMCTGIAPTTSVSISMEGSKFQNLKALPIKFKDIMWSKILFNLTLALPVVIISTIVFACFVPMGWWVLVLALAYIIVTVMAQTALGLLLNLRFPRLNWTSETQAAKGGLSMFLTMILDLVISIAPMVVFIALMVNMVEVSIVLFMGIVLIISLAFAIVIFSVLITQGEKIFKKIQV